MVMIRVAFYYTSVQRWLGAGSIPAAGVGAEILAELFRDVSSEILKCAGIHETNVFWTQNSLKV
jgi:hypothetical protein